MRGGRAWRAGGLALAVGLLVGLVACGGPAPEVTGSPSPPTAPATASPTSPAPSSPAPLSSPAALDYPSHSDIEMVAGRPDGLSVRRLVLPGSWKMRDYTDKVCAMEFYANKPIYPPRTTYLVDLATGRRRLALGRPVNAAAHFQILGAKISDHWIAWEEVGPGDDLVVSVPWALYAARYDPRTLMVGRAVLVDSGNTRDRRQSTTLISSSEDSSGVTRTKARPLFDFSGDTLCWMGNVTGAKSVGRVRAVDLGVHRPRLIYKTANTLGTVNASDGRAIVTEYPSDGSAGSLSVVDVRTRELVERFGLGEGYRVAHFPSVRNGMLAWAVFSADYPDAMYPDLYSRDQQDRFHYIVHGGHDPCLIGGWLFFVRSFADSHNGMRRWMAEVDVVDCAANVGYTLAKGYAEGTGNWVGGFGAPATAHTFVAYNDMALGGMPGLKKVTLLDVYRVR